MNRNIKNKGPRGNRRGGRMSQGLGGMSIRPPPFVPTFAIRHKFRFTSGANTVSAFGITRGMLLNLYSMASTTSLQFRLITALKLRRVRVWGATGVAVASGLPQTITVEWVGNQAPSTLHSDTGTGIIVPFVDTVPPPDSSDRWWSISGTNESEVLFEISCLTGTTIDIDCTLRFADNEAAVAAEAGTALGAVAGTVYYNYLDGFAAKKLAPVGGVTVLP